MIAVAFGIMGAGIVALVLSSRYTIEKNKALREDLEEATNTINDQAEYIALLERKAGKLR